MIVIFVEFINQLIDYPINRASPNEYQVCIYCLYSSGTMQSSEHSVSYGEQIHLEDFPSFFAKYDNFCD